jgi:hypothetical protein
MPRAFLSYFSDYVLSSTGQPVAGTTAAAYPTSAFATGLLPTGGSVGFAAAAQAVSDATGRYTLAGLPPDDYHILITYTPPGGSQVATWRYHVPIVAAEAVRRASAGLHGQCLPRTLSALARGLNVAIVALGDDVTVGFNATGVPAGGGGAVRGRPGGGVSERHGGAQVLGCV